MSLMETGAALDGTSRQAEPLHEAGPGVVGYGVKELGEILMLNARGLIKLDDYVPAAGLAVWSRIEEQESSKRLASS